MQDRQQAMLHARCAVDERIQKDNEARARREGKGKRRISKNR
jgi:hypothetical protein